MRSTHDDARHFLRMYECINLNCSENLNSQVGLYRQKLVVAALLVYVYNNHFIPRFLILLFC